jgi:hypothetical protein
MVAELRKVTMGTLQEELAKLLKSKKPQDPKQEKTLEELQGEPRRAAEYIPEGLFPHEALKKKRERLKQLDEETKE